MAFAGLSASVSDGSWALWLPALRHCLIVSDHRGSNSQVIDFESIKISPIFTVKTENPEKSNT
jgi:hypothetical protein